MSLWTRQHHHTHYMRGFVLNGMSSAARKGDRKNTFTEAPHHPQKTDNVTGCAFCPNRRCHACPC